MQKIAETHYYKKAFQELNYSFGNFYLFENFVVAEIKEDIVFNWKDHAKLVVDEIIELYEDNANNIVYISNRVNDYSVIPSDWLKFFKYSHSIRGYAIVSHGKQSILEKLFMKSKMRNFCTLSSAIKWAQEINGTEKMINNTRLSA